MLFSELIDLLHVTLERPLEVGEIDDVLTFFNQYGDDVSHSNTVKKSSVLLFFYPKNNIPHLLFIKRSTYKGAHSGQVALPGGKQEPDDIDAIHTAVREAHEEVAIQAPNILGTLSDIYVPVSGFNITPVVGYLENRPVFIPEEREVDSIIEFPVHQLLANPFFDYGPVTVNKHMKINTYYFHAGEHIVWGATAKIIAELRNYLLRETIGESPKN